MESAGHDNGSGSPDEMLVEPGRQLGPGASEEVHPDESKQNVERGAEERKMEMDTQAAGDARTVRTLGRRFGAVYDNLSKEAEKLESELLESPDPQMEAKLAELKKDLLYYAKLFYGDGNTYPLELKDIQRLAHEQLKAGPIDDLENEDRLYLETIAAGYKKHESPIVATCDLESFCNAGKGVDALAEAEKITAKALRFHEDRPEDANAAKAFLENPEEEVPFLAGEEGITMMSPLISCSIMLLKQKLGRSFRFISDKLEGDNLADTFILKPQAFVAHAPNGPVDGRGVPGGRRGPAGRVRAAADAGADEAVPDVRRAHHPRPRPRPEQLPVRDGSQEDGARRQEDRLRVLRGRQVHAKGFIRQVPRG